MKCTAQTRADEPCGAFALAGTRYCINHQQDATGRAAHRAQSQKGGKKRAQLAKLIVLADDKALASADYSTAEGLRALLAALLRALTQQPTTLKLAYALTQVAAAQRAAIDTSDIERRLLALEAGRAA